MHPSGGSFCENGADNDEVRNVVAVVWVSKERRIANWRAHGIPGPRREHGTEFDDGPDQRCWRSTIVRFFFTRWGKGRVTGGRDGLTHPVLECGRDVVGRDGDGKIDDALGPSAPHIYVFVNQGEPVQVMLENVAVEVEHGGNHPGVARDADRLADRLGEALCAVPFIVVFLPIVHGKRSREQWAEREDIAELWV